MENTKKLFSGVECNDIPSYFQWPFHEPKLEVPTICDFVWKCWAKKQKINWLLSGYLT
jgi:hypothetical protein